ncbi:myosin light chain kinase, smooth muscle-like isoform X4 [Sinocyclocheilus anshuiensis]|uniref:myosin light chain kinase, smooth muscle-like isoform X2 n=1 Tax=Sinocyclocheilus anshuiensis TaxID=1608454 RepID=UPI0007B9967D|nr:PREDICTED: myosin light chain kinase, smooth muscle-like isoform X2 [Sinocyclocheilus anshuiensis]XP_016302506.1 PREDICTED: myosin light chain kinase, smooth muscle-like isoform X4 [Sinocyclocheilus anshuiensis]
MQRTAQDRGHVCIAETQRHRKIRATWIQLSSSQSKGDNGQVSQPAHIPTITTDVKKPGETSNAVSSKHSHTSGLDPPLFTEPLEDCIVDEGNDITLKGTITGSQPISVSWLHNGEPVLFGKSSLVGGVVTLVVRECLPEDAGAYTCVAENTAGKTSSSSAVCVRDYETIIGIRNNIANTSHSHPNSSHPHTPDMLSGVLNSSQNVPDDISVFKGPQSPQSPQTGSPITSSPALKREVLVKRRSSSGTAPPLQFVDPLDRLEVHVGETARLKCVFKGSSPVASCWVYNKKEVVESSRFHIESCNESSSLVISEALPEDSGRYTIFVRDRKSSAQHTVTLNVIDLPQPPASCPVAYVLSPHSLVLSWSGPSYDGGSAVTGYVVEVCESPGATDQWRELTAQCKSTSLRVTSGLQPQGEYCFRVRACNAVGVSEPSQESQPIRMDKLEPCDEKPVEYVAVTINTEDKLTDHYNVHEKLGVGKFGQVFRMTHKEMGRVCAGKFYKGRRTKEREAARKEIELMNFLHHPKLVQCLAAYDNKAEMVMVMEYVAGGELFERIVDDSFEHTEVSSVGYMRQILEGIQYMHQQNIVHLDLKPENIVCVDRTGIQVKIIDFGLASKLDPNTPVKVMHGTPEFVAPEVINYEPICLATDMWSIGVICYILLSGESPFQGESDSETLTLVTAAQWEFDEESFEDITDLAKDFISSLLSKDVRRRMSCEEAMAHSWLVYTCVDSSSSSSTKNLSKDKMKRFLTRQKWKKTGKALLALKRMAILSKPEASASLSPVDETEKALHSLELKLQSKPEFSKTLSDLTVPQGSSAQLSCLITGYPDPEVVWLKAGELLELQEECVQVDYEEDGSCTLTLENVSLHHSGLYSCKATNVLGEALCSATLTVQQKD